MDADRELCRCFDGQHHKITGLKVSIADYRVGLFSQIDAGSGPNASVSNLHVSGDVENTKPSEYDCAGGICGNNSTGVIANCSFSGSVRGVGIVGGIAGECNGKLFLVRAQHPFSANMQVVLPGGILLEMQYIWMLQ